MSLKFENNIRLNSVLCDWLTLTSYDPTVYVYWQSKRHQIEREARKAKSREKKIMQYEGETTATDDGNFFTGKGMQNGRIHYLIQVSGQLADGFILLASRQVRDGVITCTRVDLQMTVFTNPAHDQFALHYRLNSGNLQTGWQESHDSLLGRMATVYVGSRHSQRFVRIYDKKSANNDRLLRFEVEFKKPLSMFIMRECAKGYEEMRAVFKAECIRLADSQLYDMYMQYLEGEFKHISVKRQSSDERTEHWLLTAVLPSFVRIINSHGSNGEVAHRFQKALDDVDNFNR